MRVHREIETKDPVDDPKCGKTAAETSARLADPDALVTTVGNAVMKAVDVPRPDLSV
jgi:hypothetical protein